MSGPDSTGRPAARDSQSAGDAQYQAARDSQFESSQFQPARDAQYQPGRDAQWQGGQPQYPQEGARPSAPGYAVNPYQPNPGSGPDTGSTSSVQAGGQPSSGEAGAGQYSAGQYGAGQYGGGQNKPGEYGAGQYNPGQDNPGQYNPARYGSGQYGADPNVSTGGYQPAGYGAGQSATGPAAGGSGNPYPPPPAWGQGNPFAPDQFQTGQDPGAQGRRRQRQNPTRTLNPEKALGVAVAVLGGLNFIFGFLPQYTGGSTSGNFSVYAVGPGYVPILLLIAGLLALAAFVPGSERSRLAVAAVSVGGAVGAVISIGTTSPGTASLGTGMGAILLTIFGIVQAVIAIGGYVVGAGISPRAGSSAPGSTAGPGESSADAAGIRAASVNPTPGGSWAGPQNPVPGWPGAAPGQPPGPTGDQRSAAGNSWQATGQRPDQGQWRPDQSAEAPAHPGQYSSAAVPVPPNAAGTYASYGQQAPGGTYGGRGYSEPNLGKPFSSPSYAEQAHAGQAYFGQPSPAQYPSADAAATPPGTSQFDPAEPETGPQSVVGMESPRPTPPGTADGDPAGSTTTGNPADRERREAAAQSDVVDLVKPADPPPTGN